MIVTDKNVSDALAYLADDPHPIALARKDLTDAENASKKIFAEMFRASSGSSVGAREAEAVVQPEYTAAKKTESEAFFEFERHRARTRAAEMLIEVWRSENANVRAAERVR